MKLIIILWDCLLIIIKWLFVCIEVSFNFGCVYYIGVGIGFFIFIEFIIGVYIELLDKKFEDENEDNMSYCDGFKIFFVGFYYLKVIYNFIDNFLRFVFFCFILILILGG